MTWFIGITLILLGYIAVYWRRGITHPVPLALAYWLVMIPGAYFLIHGAGLPFIYMGRLSATPISQIDMAGLYLFSFLAITVLAHYFFSRTVIYAPMIDCRPRINCVIPTFGMMLGLLAAYVAINGPGALMKSLALRTFVSTGFGAYFELVLEAFILMALVQVCATGKKYYIVGFLFVIFVYSAMLARTGLLILVGMAFLNYLCMVNRIVPRKTLGITMAILVPFSLIQGILRLRGALNFATIEWLFGQLQSSTSWNFVIVSFASRVNQLNAFADMSNKLNNGTLPTDPLDPIYVFAQIVPRSVWPDKPAMFTDHLTTILAPRVHENGTVFNFVGPAELMYAFGIIAGIILTAVMYGYIFAMFDRYYRECLNRPGIFLFFAVLLYPVFSSGTQAGFFNSITMLTFLANAAILIMICRMSASGTVRPADGQSDSPGQVLA